MPKHFLKSLIVLCVVIWAAFLPVSCAANPNEPKFDILPALQGLKLTGKLIFIALQQDGNQIVALDLASGKTHVLFSGTPRSYLAAAEVAPDGKQILLAYAPPPPNKDVQFSLTELYRMPAIGGSAPTPLLVRFDPNEAFFLPTWAPEGKTIYYGHHVPSSTAPSGFEERIEQMKPGSEPHVLIENAIWPRLSPDGMKIMYQSVKPEDADNTLFWANADGSNPQHVIRASQPVVVDAHLFAPDGKSVFFSMVNPPQSFQPPEPRSLWADFTESLGVKPVFAHSLPSDWYRVDLAGGQIQQISHLQDYGMFATFSPDGQWMAIISQQGITLMKPDGSQATKIANIPAFGSVNWVR